MYCGHGQMVRPSCLGRADRADARRLCVKSEYSRTRGKQNPSSPSNQKWWDITLAKSNLRPGGPHNETRHADALLQARNVATSSRLQGVSTRRQKEWHMAEEPSRISPFSLFGVQPFKLCEPLSKRFRAHCVPLP